MWVRVKREASRTRPDGTRQATRPQTTSSDVTAGFIFFPSPSTQMTQMAREEVISQIDRCCQQLRELREAHVAELARGTGPASRTRAASGSARNTPRSARFVIDVTSSDIDGDDSEVERTPSRPRAVSRGEETRPPTIISETTSPQRDQIRAPVVPQQPSTPSPTKRRQSRLDLMDS